MMMYITLLQADYPVKYVITNLFCHVDCYVLYIPREMSIQDFYKR
jgi:hypothetical protein